MAIKVKYFPARNSDAHYRTNASMSVVCSSVHAQIKIKLGSKFTQQYSWDQVTTT